MAFRLHVPSLNKGFLFLRQFLKENIGKVILAFSLSLLPLIGVIVYWTHFITLLDIASEDLETLRIKAAKSSRDKKIWESYIRSYSKANPFYFEDSIEQLTFLSSEEKKLSALLEAAMFSNHGELQKRYRYITSGENVLRFSEQNIFESKKWKESILRQLKPVEIDETDLIMILQKIEGRLPGKPQCIITACTLEDKEGGIIFTMECLKRELLEE